MKLNLCSLLILVFAVASAHDYSLEGKVGEKYPIVIQLNEAGKGIFSGRYAYTSTLQRDGDKPSSWLTIRPSNDSPYSEWMILDCRGKQVETWYNVHFTNHECLDARMKNIQGKSYDIVACIAGQSALRQSLTSYFRQHVGDCVSDFDMFNAKDIKPRLRDMMGIENYNFMTHIYQAQIPIEYHSGMYWASGFMAHQCCDPAAIWAYDTAENAFYVCIRKDEQEYWWSETGSIPLKFRRLVEENL